MGNVKDRKDWVGGGLGKLKNRSGKCEGLGGVDEVKNRSGKCEGQEGLGPG